MPSLSAPLVLGEARLRNRNLMSGMIRNRAPAGVPTQHTVEYYAQRAASAGLVVTEGTLVSPQGTAWPDAPGIWSAEQTRAWRTVVDAVHRVGGTIFCQLWHVGRLAHPDMPGQHGKPVPGPSPVAARGGRFRMLPGAPGYVTPTPIANPWDIVLEYKNAAQNAKHAGFDGVELHAGGGYLPHQFLDSSSNRRTDAWGGPPENRARLALELVRALIEVWGCDRVGVRLAPAGGAGDVGMPLPDTLATYAHLAAQLDRWKVIYVTLVRYVEAHDPIIDGRPRGTRHDVLHAYRGHIARPYLILAGGLAPPAAEELLRARLVDAVAFGRLWLAHPDLQRRVARGVPCDTPVDAASVCAVRGGDVRRGYTDYPAADLGGG